MRHMMPVYSLLTDRHGKIQSPTVLFACGRQGVRLLEQNVAAASSAPPLMALFQLRPRRYPDVLCLS
jgi:hypothetical protein